MAEVLKHPKLKVRGNVTYTRSDVKPLILHQVTKFGDLISPDGSGTKR